ncbi:MAG: O-antigen polymerase [Fibrobacteraceae bacterium]
MISWIFEYPESTILFSVAFVCLILFLWMKRDFFSPANIYCFSQVMMVGIAYLKLNQAMTDFKLITWLFWIGGMFAFLTGCWLVNLVWKSKVAPEIKYPLVLHQDYDWRKHFFLSLVAFGFFLIGFFAIISIAGNLILFTESPGDWMGKNPKVGSFANYFCSSPMVVGLFGVASFKSFNPLRGYRIASRIMALVTICLSFMAFPNRGTTFVCVGILLVLYNYLHKKLSFAFIGVTASLLLAAFIGIAMLRGQYGNGSLDGLVLDAVIDLPYKYVANNYWNFDYALNPPSDRDRHPWTYGVDTFFGILYFVHVGPALRESNGWDTPYNESVEKINGLNTVSYLWDAYKDFRVPGIFLVPLFFGIVFTFIYRRLAVLKSPKELLFHSMFVFWILMWSFTTGYKQSMYWIWMAFFYVVPTLCQRKSLPDESFLVEKENTKKGCAYKIAAEGQ